jgi:hypothetical protein
LKKALVGILKLGIPLGIGVWLIYKQYHDLGPAQREELYAALRDAGMGWVALSMVVGLLSHMSRGWRWRYLLEPLGHAPGFWNCYHAVMIGYFMNLFLPRAGEASRAATLYRADKVPFEQGFGTILAERALDVLMLLGIAGLTLLLQLDKLDLFQQRIADFRVAQGRAPDEGSGLGWWLLGGLCSARSGRAPSCSTPCSSGPATWACSPSASWRSPAWRRCPCPASSPASWRAPSASALCRAASGYTRSSWP